MQRQSRQRATTVPQPPIQFRGEQRGDFVLICVVPCLWIRKGLQSLGPSSCLISQIAIDKHIHKKLWFKEVALGEGPARLRHAILLPPFLGVLRVLHFPTFVATVLF